MQGRAPTNCILCLTMYVVLFLCVVSHSPLSINISLMSRSSSLSDHTGRENKYTRFMHRQKNFVGATEVQSLALRSQMWHKETKGEGEQR